MNSIVEERKQRWLEFYDSGCPRRFMLLVNDPSLLTARPYPHPDKLPQRIEWAWDKYQRQLDSLTWLEDDSLPFLDPYTGTEIFAEAFGCRIHRPENDMPFALPLVHNATEASRLKVPDLSTAALSRLFEIIDELRKRAGPEAMVRLIDVQGPLDIAALIWDKNDFYTAMLETPEAVRELCAKTQQLLCNFLDEWFSRYGTEFIAHYPDYYMPKGLTLSEDEVGAISPIMFLDFILPELQALSNRYGSLGMHCCATARHQWKNFTRIPNLRMLNFVRPEAELKEAYSFFADFVPQMHSWCGEGDPWTWPSQYPETARVVLQLDASTRRQAIEICQRIREVIG